MPFSSRYDGNDCEIIYHAEKYDFRKFSQSMIRYAKRFVITYDGFVLKNSGVLSDDVAYTVCDYLKSCYKINTKKRMEKPAVRAKSPSVRSNTHLANRILDLQELFNHYGGELPHRRNCYLYDLGTAVFFAYKKTEEELCDYLLKKNAQFVSPLSEPEVLGIARSVARNPHYRSDEKLNELYCLSDLRQMKNKYLPWQKKAAKRKYQKSVDLKKRKETKKRKSEKIRLFLACAKKTANVSEIARNVGWSRPTVYKYLKIFAKLIEKLRKNESSAMPLQKKFFKEWDFEKIEEAAARVFLFP